MIYENTHPLRIPVKAATQSTGKLPPIPSGGFFDAGYPVSGELMYETRQEWHSPPPPDMPAPPQSSGPEPSDYPSQ